MCVTAFQKLTSGLHYYNCHFYTSTDYYLKRSNLLVSSQLGLIPYLMVMAVNDGWADRDRTAHVQGDVVAGTQKVLERTLEKGWFNKNYNAGKSTQNSGVQLFSWKELWKMVDSLKITKNFFWDLRMIF